MGYDVIATDIRKLARWHGLVKKAPDSMGPGAFFMPGHDRDDGAMTRTRVTDNHAVQTLMAVLCALIVLAGLLVAVLMVGEVVGHMRQAVKP